MSHCCRFMALLAATLAGTSVAAPNVLHATPSVASARALSPTSAGAPAALPRTVDDVIAGLYAGVSGAADAPRDWTAFARLFVPDARIGVTTAQEGKGVEVQLMDVAAFAALNERVFAGRGFFETELHREQSGYGNVLHVWSVYEARRALGDAPYARGANSLQLVHTPEGWRIAALTWDRERDGQPLAARFTLPAGVQAVAP
ncbi:hypothetical protein [Lysobacter olei]